MNNNNSTEQHMEFLLAVKSSAPVKWTMVLNGAINMVGMALDSMLLAATIRNKSLHNTCSILIACYRVCASIGFLEIFIPLAVLLVPPDDWFVSARTCAFIQLLPMAATVQIMGLMLAIAFDRLLSVFMPLWYSNRNDMFYLGLLFAASTVPPLFTVFVILRNGLASPAKLTFCTMGDALGDDGTALTILVVLTLICASAMCYVVVWAKLKWDLRGNNAETLSSRAPIFKSLLVLLVLQVIGWAGGVVGFGASLLTFPTQSVQKIVADNLANTFICIWSAADTPALYFTSSEHRRCLRREWEALLKLFGKKNAPNVVTVLSASRQNNAANNSRSIPQISQTQMQS